MKVIKDDDLSVKYKFTQTIAKDIAKEYYKQLEGDIIDLFKNDHKFGELDYSEMMTFINTIGTFIYCYVFKLSCNLGRQFPDVGHSSRDIFEETIKGIRLFLDMPEIDKKEYVNGIKKIDSNRNN